MDVIKNKIKEEKYLCIVFIIFETQGYVFFLQCKQLHIQNNILKICKQRNLSESADLTIYFFE